ARTDARLDTLRERAEGDGDGLVGAGGHGGLLYDNVIQTYGAASLTASRDSSDMDRLAGHRHRGFLERLRVRRVGVAGVGDVLAGRAELHRLGGLGDHRAGDAGDHPHAEHAVGRGVGDDLHEAVGLVVGLGAAVGEHRELADLDLVAGFLRLLLGEADAGDLGHGVDDARDHRVVDDAGLAGEPFGDGDAFVLGLVREHRAGDHVADRAHALDPGTELAVDFDLAALVHFEPDL